MSSRIFFTSLNSTDAGPALDNVRITLNTSPVVCGDADGNGVVTIVDSLAVARHVAGLSPRPPVDPAAADVNADGVDIVDALMIARYVAGLPVTGTCLVP